MTATSSWRAVACAWDGGAGRKGRAAPPCLAALLFLRSSHPETSTARRYVTKTAGDRGSFGQANVQLGSQPAEGLNQNRPASSGSCTRVSQTAQELDAR